MSKHNPTSLMNEQGAVLLTRIEAVAILTLSHSSALNALTWKMYEELRTYLSELASDETVRAIVMRGDGARAFAAGTDIQQFQGFSGADGVSYEQRMDAVIDQLAAMPQPVLAAIHGYAVGAGLVIATTCDLRYATPAARFGSPMARTLGNCLSLKNYKRLAEALGAMRTKELLFTARLLSADEALRCGFLTAIIDEDQFFEQVLSLAKGISELAPLTLRATKEALRRLDKADEGTMPDFDDVVAQVYGSHDFAEGVQAHKEKRPPIWSGQ